MYSGDVMELDEDGAAVTGKVHTGAIMVDGLEISSCVTASICPRTESWSLY